MENKNISPFLYRFLSGFRGSRLPSNWRQGRDKEGKLGHYQVIHRNINLIVFPGAQLGREGYQVIHHNINLPRGTTRKGGGTRLYTAI